MHCVVHTWCTWLKGRGPMLLICNVVNLLCCLFAMLFIGKLYFSSLLFVSACCCLFIASQEGEVEDPSPKWKWRCSSWIWPQRTRGWCTTPYSHSSLGTEMQTSGGCEFESPWLQIQCKGKGSHRMPYVFWASVASNNICMDTLAIRASVVNITSPAFTFPARVFLYS